MAILKNGGDPNLLDGTGVTPVMMAVRLADSKAARCLSSHVRLHLHAFCPF